MSRQRPLQAHTASKKYILILNFFCEPLSSIRNIQPVSHERDLSVCLSVCLPVRLSVCPSVCLSVCLSVRLSVWLPVCVSLSVRVYVCLSHSYHPETDGKRQREPYTGLKKNEFSLMMETNAWSCLFYFISVHSLLFSLKIEKC